MRLIRCLLAVCVLFLTGFAAPAGAGGPLTSGQTVAGNLAGPSFLESWTFNGNVGQQALISAVTTSGLVNTGIVLRAPGGAVEATSGNADRLEVALASGGVYSIEISDNGLNDAGAYAMTFLNLTAGPLTSGADLDGGPVASAEVRNGTSVVGDFDAFTFTGTLNDRVLINLPATAGGAGYNTTVYLYGPTGTSATNSGGGDQLDFKLTATGTWTVVVEDLGDESTGSYTLTLLNVTSGPLTSVADPDGGPIASNEIKTGGFSVGADMDAFTFTGTSGQTILLSALATGAGTHNTQSVLYPPGGGAAVVNATADRNEYTLAATGTYTLVLFDNGFNDGGAYQLSFLNVNGGPLTSGADLDGGPIASAEVRNGTSVVGDFDAFTFTGTLNDRVLINLPATAGGVGYNTTVYLYGPTGTSATNSGGGDQLDFKLTATGTWTVVVEDLGDESTGGYTLTLLNVTSGPLTSGADPDGGPIASNEIKTGGFSVGADMDAFTFAGTSGQTILLSALATGGGTHNTQSVLYPPGGGAAVVNATADRNEYTLAATGTYTLVLFDNGFNDGGAYQLSFLNVNGGPLTSGADLDGGPIASAEVRNGTSVVGDFDAFTFTGTLNDRILINLPATAGGVGYNTTVYLYGPTGTSATNSGGGDQLDFKLTATGTWTVAVEDVSNNDAGGYTITLLNVTSGPLTSVADPDGGPIASNEIKTGGFSVGADMDAFTFAGTSGQTILLSALATGGGTHNTQSVLYPPGGGAAVVNATADRNEYTLAATGTYTLVLFDNGFNDGGAYQLSFLNVNGGPLTSGADLDGGPIASAEVRNGTSVVGDFDAFTFTGTLNDRVLINLPATAGGVGYNTTVYLYGPTGTSATNSGGGDQLDFKLTATGTWTVVVEDLGDESTGGYTLTLLNVTSGPLTSGADPDGGPIASNEIKTGGFSVGADMDAFTFAGVSGQTILLSALATGGGTHNTQSVLYPPGGGAAVVNATADRNEYTLAATGTYTLVLFDNGFNDGGAYQLSFLNVTAGAFVGGADTGGGPISSNDLKSSATATPGDFDAYQFLGTNGDRAIITASSTGGAGYNTTIYLYPPQGTSATNSGGGDRLDFKLNATGVWTIVVESLGNATTGTYNLCFLNATAGPLASGGSDGGIISTGVPINAAMDQVADIDGYTFFGSSGQTANITCVTSAGAMNTQTYLYPPGGGAAVVNTTSDTINQLLAATGYYTIVVEDNGEDQTGGYTLTLNGTGAVSGTPPDPTALPDGKRALLLPASPSPFRQNTLMAFRLGAESGVELRVYNAAGQLVRTLVSTTLSAGRHEVAWDGRDDAGQSVGSGVYYLRMRAAGEDIRQKVVRVL